MEWNTPFRSLQKQGSRLQNSFRKFPGSQEFTQRGRGANRIHLATPMGAANNNNKDKRVSWRGSGAALVVAAAATAISLRPDRLTASSWPTRVTHVGERYNFVWLVNRSRQVDVECGRSLLLSRMGSQRCVRSWVPAGSPRCLKGIEFNHLGSALARAKKSTTTESGSEVNL